MSERRKINGELCELVTDFASLRTGDVVYSKPCRFCAGTPRGMLTNLRRSLGALDPNMRQLPPMDVWDRLPEHSCDPRLDGIVISAVTVADGRLWKVIDEEVTQVTRTRELERAR